MGGGYRTVLAVARGGGLNLVGGVCSQLALLGITLLLAHVGGGHAVGQYAQAYAVLALLTLVALSGFRSALTRFVSVHVADGDRASLRGTVRLGLGSAGALSGVLAVALWAGAPAAGSALGDPALADLLRLVALALPAAALTDVGLAATQGFQSMRAYALVGGVLEPMLRLGLTGAALADGLGVRGALLALVASSWAGLLAVAAVLWRRLRVTRGVPARYQARELLSFSSVSWVASLANTALIWTDTLILGALRDSAEVGVYAVATRVVVLATFVLTPITSAFGPRVAYLYRRGETDTLERTYQAATTWILRLSLPAFAVLLVFPDRVLTLFGGAFAAGAAVTVILAVGKLLDAATGPSGLMLNMSGHNRLSAVNNVVVLALNVALNLLLVPRYGIVGAAVAWAVAIWAVNLARLVEVHLVLRMRPFSTAAGKAALAALGALTVAALLRGLTDLPGELAFGVGAVGLTYLALLSVLGLGGDDRLLLAELRRHLPLGRPRPA